MTTLEKELFDFCKQLVNHISKDGYDLLKKMYVLEQKLQEDGGIPDVSIHAPIVETIQPLEQDVPLELDDTRDIDTETGEVLKKEEIDPFEQDLPVETKQTTSNDLDDLDDLSKDSDLPEDDLPF